MRRLLILTIALIPGLWLAVPAGAAPPATLHVTPTTVPAGGSVQVSGTCESNTDGFAISHAFLHDATHDFAGVGAAPFTTDAAGAFSVTATIPSSTAAGSYNVTARCGGGNLGIAVTLTVTAASGPPTAVPAGSGGRAATTGPGTERRQVLLAGLGGALLLACCAGLARRHHAAR
jgi:hypothetical protein